MAEKLEERLKQIEEKLDLLSGICTGLADKIKEHESLQGQKETAIFNHIETVKNSFGLHPVVAEKFIEKCNQTKI